MTALVKNENGSVMNALKVVADAMHEEVQQHVWVEFEKNLRVEFDFKVQALAMKHV